MLDIILSHWMTYVYIVYVLVLTVIVILQRHQPVETAGRPSRSRLHPHMRPWRTNRAN